MSPDSTRWSPTAMVLADSSSKPACSASHCVNPKCTSLSNPDELAAANNNPDDTKIRATIITPPRAMVPHAIATPARWPQCPAVVGPRTVHSTLVYFTYRNRPHTLKRSRRRALGWRSCTKKKSNEEEADVASQGETMKPGLLRGGYGNPLKFALIAFSCGALSFFSGWSSGDEHEQDDSPAPLTVPKATCGENDHPETALQGQVTAAMRAAGFQGFNCNLKLVGQSRGDGANWQTTEFRDEHHHVCAYHGTAFTTANRTHLGVPVIDVTEPEAPTPTGYLATTSMLDPWESLKVNAERQLLAADNAHNGAGGPEVDIYDLSGDCREPQLLASVAVGTATGGGDVSPVIGHEGSWAPDGLTYYGGDLFTKGGQYFAVDTTDVTAPKLITTWQTGIGPCYGLFGLGCTTTHGMSISDDGNRGYFVSLAGLNSNFADLTDPTKPGLNGLLIYDLSDIQARLPNPQPRLISTLLWKDGSTAQHTIPVKIGGKPFVIFVDEGGAGGI